MKYNQKVQVHQGGRTQFYRTCALLVIIYFNAKYFRYAQERSTELFSKNCSEVVDDVKGGIMEADSAGSLPRNRQQVSNLRQSVTGNNERRRKNVKGTRDELSAVMEMCINQSRVPGMAFVRKSSRCP